MGMMCGTIERLIESGMARLTPERCAEVEEFERRQREHEREDRYRRNVPERYWRERLDTYSAASDEQRVALAAALSFAEDARNGKFRTLLLLGSVGTGKTHLACGIVRECGGLYRTAAGIAGEIRGARSFSARETEAEIIGRYASARLLVVDEIGRGMSATEEQYMLYNVINGRYNTRKPTVLVSNKAKREFLGYVGIAAADRLTESAQTVEFTGGSYRASKRHEA